MIVVSRGHKGHILPPPHPLHRPIAQHAQARLAKRSVYVQQGPHLGGRQSCRMLLEERDETPAPVAPRVRGRGCGARYHRFSLWDRARRWGTMGHVEELLV